MSKVIVHTRGGPLTDDDFETEAPAPGTSDHKYDDVSRADMTEIAARVRQMARGDHR